MILSKDKLYYAKLYFPSEKVWIETYFYVDELKDDGKDLKAVCNDTISESAAACSSCWRMVARVQTAAVRIP